MGATTILVLDDGQRSLEGLADALEGAGYAPVSVGEGDDLLGQFEALMPELVFLSLNAASALDICEGIRATGHGAIVPIIFVGNDHAMVRSPSEALTLGGDYHFGQPLELAKVLAKVQTYVGAPAPREVTNVDVAPVVDLARLAGGPPSVDLRAASSSDLASASDDLLAQIEAESRVEAERQADEDLARLEAETTAARAAEQTRRAAEERRQAEYAAQLRAKAEEEQRRADEEAERFAEEEERRAETRRHEEARRVADAERLAQEEIRVRAEQARERSAAEARRRAEEESRRRATEEAERLAEEARLEAAAETRRRNEEAALARRDAEERAQREEAQRLAEEEAQRQADEEIRRIAEEDARLKEEARRRAEEERFEQERREEARRVEEARRADEHRLEQERVERARRAEDERREEQRREEERLERERLAEHARLERQRLAEDERREEQRREAERLERERLAEHERLERERIAADERREADERRRAEEEARRQAEEAQRFEEEARRKAEVARRLAEAEARRRAEDEARRLAEEEALRKAEEEIRQRAEDERRRKAEEDAQRRAEEDARRQAEEEAQRAAEAARRKLEDELARAEVERIAAVEAAERAAAEEQRRKAEDTARRKFGGKAAELESERPDGEVRRTEGGLTIAATIKPLSGAASTEPRRPVAIEDDDGGDPDVTRVVPAPAAPQMPPATSQLLSQSLVPQMTQTTAPARGQRAALRAFVPAEGVFSGGADMADLLAEVYRQQVTGRIDFSSGTRQKSVVFERGHAVDAYSSQVHDRMEEFLAREGRITRAQYNEVRVKGLRGPRRIGAFLVNEGYLRPDELFTSVRAHLEELIYSLFEWDVGAYGYVSEHVEDEDRVMLDRDPRAIVAEGIRRKYLLPRAVAKLGSPSSLLTRTDPEGRIDAEALGLTADERQIARLVDGTRNIDDIVFSSGLGALRVYHVLAALCATGYAEVAVRGIDGIDLGGATDLDGIDRQRILERVEQVRQADYFQILGLHRGATTYEVEVAFDRITRELAPPRLSPAIRGALKNEIDEIERVLEDAREVLRDQRMRESYARNLPRLA